MKPKNLKPPFSWKERAVIWEDQVLYVPGCLPEYSPPADSWKEIFETGRPCTVELCSGNGDWVVERAASCPGQTWIAVEKRFDRVRKIWSKRENRGLDNLVIVCGEALTVMRHFFPSHRVEACFVNFPDPWPKTRHAKHRLVQRPFLEELHRVLQPGGRFVLVTDDAPYRDQAALELEEYEGFSPSARPEQLEGYGQSWFERLWRKKEREVHTLEAQTSSAATVS